MPQGFLVTPKAAATARTESAEKPFEENPVESTAPTRRQLPVLCVAYFFCYLGVGSIQQYIKPYLESIESTERYSGTAASWVLGTVYLSGILVQFAAVWMTRHLGARASVLLGLGFATFFSWLIALTTQLPVLIAAAPIWSLGAACLWVAGPSLVFEETRKGRYGTATSFLYFAVFLGQAIGVCLLGWVAKEFGKPHLFWTAAALSTVANLVALAVPAAKAEIPRVALAEGLRVLRSREGVIVAFLMTSSSFGFGILLNNLSSSVEETRGFGSIGFVTLGFFATRLLFGIAAGPWSDRLGQWQVLVAGYGAAALGLFAAGLWDHPLVLAGAALSLGVQIGASNVAITALVGDWAPPEKRHVVLGTVFLWKYLGTASTIILGQYLKVWLDDYRPTFLVFGALMLACVFLSFWLRKATGTPQA